MTDPAIIAASYAAERNYSHNPDDVIDPSDAVGAWGTAKESTTELVDLSGHNNKAAIKGPMPIEGFIQGRRFTSANENHLDCGSGLETIPLTYNCVFFYNASATNQHIVGGSGHSYPQINIITSHKINFLKQGQVSILVSSGELMIDKFNIVTITYSAEGVCICTINGDEVTTVTNLQSFVNRNLYIGGYTGAYSSLNIVYIQKKTTVDSNSDTVDFFNTLARLPFWSVNYTDYPDNATEYTDNLPYSSSIISSGTFKVDGNKLQCVSAGTMTYSASYEFDGSEYIKVEIDGVEYAGTSTITVGNTTVSVAQGSNKVTIQMGTGDTIEGEIGIQFRAEV